MHFRDVAGQDGGVRENFWAVLACVFLDYPAESALDVARECREEWNILSVLHMCPPSISGWKCFDTFTTGK